MLHSLVTALRGRSSESGEQLSVEPGSLAEIALRTWHLGVTFFGGPSVHFQLQHKLFVEKLAWIEEGMYQQLFALCQALPGPASTKMLYCICFMRAGFLGGVLAFLFWSIPPALAAYGLSLGIARVGTVLPAPIDALLTGLNASTVGIIALAAVQLSQKAVTDQVTRMLVFFGGAAGMLYNALWYFPVLMSVGGVATVVWDYRVPHRLWKVLKRAGSSRGAVDERVDEASLAERQSGMSLDTGFSTARDEGEVGSVRSERIAQSQSPQVRSQEDSPARTVSDDHRMHTLSWKSGLCIILAFVVTFIVIMVLRGTLDVDSRGFELFANMYLAGTIIFGGGPVVIPLLREYIVAEGWVSERDFLLGLAIIQAFPGPNFNFAVYLGSLAAVSSVDLPSAAGAIIGFLGIFSPGMIIVAGTMGVWDKLRKHRWMTSCLRGVHAAAVGLVYTAVYRLWEIGYVQGGTASSLDSEPWWVVVTATSFVGGRWYNFSAPFAILLGGVMGLIWYGVVKA